MDNKTAAKLLARFVGKPGTYNPEISHVLLSEREAVATDGQTWIRVGVEASGLSCPCLVPATMIKEVLESGVTLTDTTIKIGGTTVPALDTSTFPSMPDCYADAKRTPPTDFAERVAAVLPGVSKDDTRVGLNGAHLSAQGVLVATDGHRLFACGPKVQGPLPTGLISRDACAKIASLPKIDWIGEVPGFLVLSGYGWTMATRWADGEFPEWKQVVPAEFNSTVTVRTDTMIEACKQAEKTNKGKDQSIMRCEVNGAIDWHSKNIGTQATSEGRIDHEGHSGPDFKIGLNPRYFREALGFCGDRAKLNVGEEKTSKHGHGVNGSSGVLAPVVFTGNLPGRLAVLMPMRLD